uniref:Osteoclast associated Ig-like receptor n=1 Tax=Pipistrellus kuhlii TaxID=59472 RepID=A0A7J7QS40_PIPKU|nr:osteoclast associated Ig-like receptor [Pipistrellus kuhlii]
MVLVLTLQLLALSWPLCHTGVTSDGNGPVPPGGGDHGAGRQLPLRVPQPGLVPAQRRPGVDGDRAPAAPVAGGAARGPAEPALHRPRRQHELRAVPRGRGAAAAGAPVRAALGRLPAAPRPGARHLHLLLPHARRALRAVPAQRAAGHQPGG